MAQWKQIQLGTRGLWVQSLALTGRLRIRGFCELWCKSQILLGSGVAVAVELHRLGATAPIGPLAWKW